MKPVKQLIQEMGEAKAKAYLRYFYSKPENLPKFSLLFKEHIPTFPPPFHLELYEWFAELKGYKGAAAPRGFAKSTVTDLVFIAWVALHAKKRFMVLISDTYGQSTMLLESLKAEIENNEKIRWIYENPQGDAWTDNDIEIMGIDTNGERKPVKIIAKGAGMKIRGLKYLNFRPDIIIFDDLENDEAVQSVDRRRKLKDWLIRGVIPALSPDGCIILIGTVLHRDSLLSNILDKKGEFSSWDSRKYSAIMDENKSLWPERFAVENLLQMRDNPKYEKYIGPLAFAQEMMNKPLAEGDIIFQPDWLSITYNLQEQLNKWHAQNPEVESSNVLQQWMHHTFSIIPASVDPAISEKQTADWWAMATLGIARACPVCPENPAGHIFLLDMHRMKEKNPNNQVRAIIDSYKQWRQDKIKIEAIAYQAGLYQLVMQKGAEETVYPPVRAYRPDRDKQRRGIVFSALVAGKMFHLRTDHPLYQAIYDEFIEFPQSDHDDMVDAIFAAAEDVTMKTKSRTFSNKPQGF